MTRVAWRMLTQHPMRAVATFVALLCGAAVLSACGVLLESALRYHGDPRQYGASAVVVASTELTIVQGSGEDLSVDNNPLPEGGRVSIALARRIAAVPGVRRVIADVTVPVLCRGEIGAEPYITKTRVARLADDHDAAKAVQTTQRDAYGSRNRGGLPEPCRRRCADGQ